MIYGFFWIVLFFRVYTRILNVCKCVFVLVQKHGDHIGVYHRLNTYRKMSLMKNTKT